MKRKVLTYFLCLSMAVTSVPSLGLTVHAEEVTADAPSGAGEEVAGIGSDVADENAAEDVAAETVADSTGEKWYAKVEAESGTPYGNAKVESPSNMPGVTFISNLDQGKDHASVTIKVTTEFEDEVEMKVTYRSGDPRTLCYEVNDGTQKGQWPNLNNNGSWTTTAETEGKNIQLQKGENTITFYAEDGKNGPGLDYITFSRNGGTEEDMKPDVSEKTTVQFKVGNTVVKTLEKSLDEEITAEELPSEEEMAKGEIPADKDFLGWFWGPSNQYEGAFPMEVQDAADHNGLAKQALTLNARYGKHVDGYSVDTVENKFGQRLIFEDNFTGNELDSDKWVDKYLSSWSDNWNRTQSYEFHPDDSENNGSMSLVINGPKDENPTLAWCPEFDGKTVISGFTTGDRNGLHNWNGGSNKVRNPHDTELTHINQYGYYEMRMKGQPGAARHSAWWLLGFEDVPEESAEVDIFEVQGRYLGKNDVALHEWNDTDAFASKNVAAGSFNNEDKDLRSEWHVYGFNWVEDGGSGNLPDRMDFYIDGQKYASANVNIDYPMIQLFSQYEKREDSGAWTGAWNWQPYPNSMEIDYVRVYKDVPEEYQDVTNPKVTEIKAEDVNIAQKDIALKTYPDQGGGADGGDYVEKNLPGTKSYVRVEWSDGVQTQEPVKWDPVTQDDIAKLKDGMPVEKQGTVTITSEPDKGAYEYPEKVTMTITPDPVPAWGSEGVTVNNDLGRMFNGVTENDQDSAEFKVNGLTKDQQRKNMGDGKAYLTYNFKQEVLLRGIDLWTNYGEKQGITEFDVYVWDDAIEADANGEKWKKVESDKSDEEEADGRFHVTWTGDALEKQSVEFAPVVTNKVKLVIRDAGLEWPQVGAGKIAMREIGFDALTSIDLTKAPGTIEYTKGDSSLNADGVQLTGTRYYANPDLSFDVPAEKDVVIHIPCDGKECNNAEECEKYSADKIEFSGYDLNTVGEQEVTLAYDGMAVNGTFQIDVKSEATNPEVLNKVPVISGAKDIILTVGDKFDPKAGVTAEDAEEGDLTKNIVVKSNVDTTKAGEYEVVYTVADGQGATATKTIRVTVKAKVVDPDTGNNDNGNQNGNNQNNNSGNENQTNKPNKNEAVQTGDTLPIGLWAVLAVLSAVALLFKRKSKRV